MKTFKQHIKEGTGYVGDAQGVGTNTMENPIEDGSVGVHNIHMPEVLKRVNDFKSTKDEEVSSMFAAPGFVRIGGQTKYQWTADLSFRLKVGVHDVLGTIDKVTGLK